jgi:hypothetical protein
MGLLYALGPYFVDSLKHHALIYILISQVVASLKCSERMQFSMTLWVLYLRLSRPNEVTRAELTIQPTVLLRGPSAVQIVCR